MYCMYIFKFTSHTEMLTSLTWSYSLSFMQCFSLLLLRAFGCITNNFQSVFPTTVDSCFQRNCSEKLIACYLYCIKQQTDISN